MVVQWDFMGFYGILWDVMGCYGIYPLVMTVTRRTGKWPSRKFVSFPIENGDVPVPYVKLPGGKYMGQRYLIIWVNFIGFDG